MIHIRRYTPDDAPAWDAFVRASRQDVFLFERGYMDYHADRFSDHSLIACDEDGDWLALLPAHTRADTLVSHGGLSFGGFITGGTMRTLTMIDVFAALAHYAHGQGWTRLLYKTVPAVYQRGAAGEDLIALALCGAARAWRGMITVIDRAHPLPMSERRRRGTKKAAKAGVRIAESDDLAAYWRLLEAVLHRQHAARPVHTSDEMLRLRARFPDRVRLHIVQHHDDLIAGVLIYRYDRVARAQYIAADERGRTLGALDLLFDRLLHDVYADVPCFDFGASTDPETGAINAGLLTQKEEFGGRPVIHDTYSVDFAALTPERLTMLRETPL